MSGMWPTLQLRRLAHCWDFVRIPLNADERADRPGDVPYWGANTVQGFVDESLIDEEVVLIGEDGAPFFDRDRPVAFRVDGPIWPNNHIHVLKTRPNVDARWLAFALNDVDYSLYITGSTRDKLTQGSLMEISLSVPPHDDQRRIAAYLEAETASIDRLIAKQEALIHTLRERRVAVRDHHFATNGPRRSTTVRRVLLPLKRAAVDGLGVVTAYRDGQVTLRSNRRDDGYTFSDSEHGYQEVLPGDLVFHALDGFAGAVGISDSHGVCTPVYHVCEVITDDVPEYVAMLLRHLGTSGFLATQAPNVRERSVDFRNWQTFARIPLDLPSPDEQRVVVADILERTTEIDLLIAKAEQFVDLARERRAALITAAVTGQIDVRGAA